MGPDCSPEATLRPRGSPPQPRPPAPRPRDSFPSFSGSLPGFVPETSAEHQPEHCRSSREHAPPTATRLLQRSSQPHCPDDEPSLLPTALPQSMEMDSEYGPPTPASACLSGSQQTTPPISNMSEVPAGSRGSRDEEQGQMEFVSGISCPMTNLKRPAGPAPEEKKRICWTDAMHAYFMKVVAELEASPDKRVIPTNIARRMKDSYDLSTSQIKSHLQKYNSGKYGPVGSRSTPVSVSTGPTSPTPSLFATCTLPRRASVPLPSSHPHTSNLGLTLPHAGLEPNAPALDTGCKRLCKRTSGSASLPIISHAPEEGRGYKHGTLSLRNTVVMTPVASRVSCDGAPSSPGVGSVSVATTGTITLQGPPGRAGGVLGVSAVVDAPLTRAASTSLYSCPPHSGPEFPHPDRVAGPGTPYGPGNSVGKISRVGACPFPCGQLHDEVEGPVFESENEDGKEGPGGCGTAAFEDAEAAGRSVQGPSQGGGTLTREGKRSIDIGSHPAIPLWTLAIFSVIIVRNVCRWRYMAQ
eukprot:gene715-2139_t